MSEWLKRLRINQKQPNFDTLKISIFLVVSYQEKYYNGMHDFFLSEPNDRELEKDGI